MAAPRVQQIVEGKGLDLAVLRDKPLICPAGVMHAGTAGVECRVEESFISCAHNPYSVALYCKGDYTQCPSWRTEKDNHRVRKAITFDHERRPGRSLLDQDPETIPTYRIPRGDGEPERL